MKQWIQHILTFLMVVTIILLSIRCCHLSSDKPTTDVYPSQTDTVYVKDYFTFIPEYKYTSIPKTRFIFLTDSVKIKDIKVERDTVKVFIKDSTSINYSPYFLTQYPSKPKLLQAFVSESSFQLALLNTNGNVYKEVYDIDTRFYNYNYNEGLTHEPKPFFSRIEPFIQTTIRPRNLMVDLDLGLNYNTRKINYEIGINGFYYNPLSNPFGWDIFFRMKYKF